MHVFNAFISCINKANSPRNTGWVLIIRLLAALSNKTYGYFTGINQSYLDCKTVQAAQTKGLE